MKIKDALQNNMSNLLRPLLFMTNDSNNTHYGPIVDSVSVDSVLLSPEPATMLLLGIGIIELAGLRKQCYIVRRNCGFSAGRESVLRPRSA